LRTYKTLAEALHTKNILIHLPANLNEYNNLNIGFEIIQSELGDDFNIHLEIPAWAKTLHHISRVDYYDEIDKYMKPNYNYVFDTAHLFANGYTTEEIINLFKKYDTKYCHLNGNLRSRYCSDSHTAIFSENNKIPDWKEICLYLSQTKIICIAEMTKENRIWNEWENFCCEKNFKLVDFNKIYSL
jgi:endonuclease IV